MEHLLCARSWRHRSTQSSPRSLPHLFEQDFQTIFRQDRLTKHGYVRGDNEAVREQQASQTLVNCQRAATQSLSSPTWLSWQSFLSPLHHLVSPVASPVLGIDAGTYCAQHEGPRVCGGALLSGRSSLWMDQQPRLLLPTLATSLSALVRSSINTC